MQISKDFMEEAKETAEQAYDKADEALSTSNVAAQDASEALLAITANTNAAEALTIAEAVESQLDRSDKVARKDYPQKIIQHRKKHQR